MNDMTPSKKDETGSAGKLNKISGKRRTLVKGAMGAAPAILTLRSGAAFALNSSEICRIKDASKQPVLLVDEDDEWLRKQVWCITLSLDGSSFKVYNPDDVQEGWMPEDFGTIGGDGLIVEDTYEKVGNSGKMKKTGGDSNVQYDATVPAQCWILYRVDSDGSVVGIGKATDDTSYITDSCWHSASPGDQLPD
ncbi:hypothetical protein Q9L42_010855 [Methylomarinum sp. Ch1-1]|uniref:Uncharacterized protein n=1 Tax=Methylomarinum roseum TaxID=3067653 RepID=A0AAU7NPK2_9GAMM|nr:hypothetical protein [Methylomarinum sp. Ch1-1]MDP4521227.1 hypothetical protein [Methylomarinum sp. Ch1-1]